MVGIFVSVLGQERPPHIRHLAISCVRAASAFPTGNKVQTDELCHVVLLGDLNYRIAMDNDEARQLVRARKWSMLLESDELLLELSKGQRFDGWHEGLVNLRP
ncbi:unnamed protein product [Miscanthus lutarioriparius]|uniref:Inositol polyphosphate-related phosphatase domain-containing protein n=1 Tax=Miscanthus lutarioriparius TaxID=422564 RepID=A0A811R5X5_9POAL|nr:unnamed protein product [Miscanthus lutarioriparius]